MMELIKKIKASSGMSSTERQQKKNQSLVLLMIMISDKIVEITTSRSVEGLIDPLKLDRREKNCLKLLMCD
jgi:hypothetical protein